MPSQTQFSTLIEMQYHFCLRLNLVHWFCLFFLLISFSFFYSLCFVIAVVTHLSNYSRLCRWITTTAIDTHVVHNIIWSSFIDVSTKKKHLLLFTLFLNIKRLIFRLTLFIERYLLELHHWHDVQFCRIIMCD